MSKINHHRKIWKPRIQIKKINKVQIPDNIYNRKDERNHVRKILNLLDIYGELE